jgi:hypothetical protein
MDQTAAEGVERPEPITVNGWRSLHRLLSNIANDLTLLIETPKFDLDIYIANYNGERKHDHPLGGTASKG